MRFNFIILIVLWATTIFGQGIHPLEPLSGHYKTLYSKSSTPQSDRAWMDTIAFPKEKYSWSIVYNLVKPFYLSDEQVDWLKTWIPAPANSSHLTEAELEYLLELQTKRTPAQVQRVTFLGDIGYWPHIDLVENHPGYQRNSRDLFFEGREILGESCTPEKYPQTALLLKGMMNDMRILEFSVKYHNLRPRPYQLEPRLQPLAVMGSPAFASGHTLWAFLQAFIWSELLPAKRQAFLELAEEIRQSREIMGIHYPSDDEAARVLAHKMLELMSYSAKFQQDYRQALAEWTIIK